MLVSDIEQKLLRLLGELYDPISVPFPELWEAFESRCVPAQ